ncbi:MAG: spore coat protein [bacterium]|nr:spore coat protein [bacterium]
MNNNKINNTKVDVPNGIKLNDKDYMNSLLSCLKEMVKNYSIALTEASNETLYSKYKEMFDTYINLQREVFETMFRYGWYSLEKLDSNKINEKYQMLSEEKISLG